MGKRMDRLLSGIVRSLARQFSGTKVIVNHAPGVSDIRVGWVAKLVVATILGLLATGVNRLFYISAMTEVLNERTIVADRTSREARDAARAVADDLAKKFADAQGIHATFLTKDDFYRYMAPEIPGPQRRQR
jgi:hypothetical protein